MANHNCAACDELRNDAPNFVVNGLGDNEIASLKNNTGLNPSSGNDNCTDLNNMNDCLIGNMDEEIELYDVCDWKDYMRQFVPNVWSMFKAIIASICGLWSKLDTILSKVRRLECIVTYIGRVQNFSIDEDNIKYRNGVVKNTDGNPDLATPRITGNAYCAYLTGSIVLPSDFESRFPSSSLDEHGALLYEYRIKMSDFGLARVYPGNLQEAVNGGDIHAHVHVFYHNSSTRPYADGNTGYASYSVPEGWCYLQVRMSSYVDIPSSGKVTICGVLPVLLNPDEIKC